MPCMKLAGLQWWIWLGWETAGLGAWCLLLWFLHHSSAWRHLGWEIWREKPLRRRCPAVGIDHSPLSNCRQHQCVPPHLPQSTPGFGRRSLHPSSVCDELKVASRWGERFSLNNHILRYEIFFWMASRHNMIRIVSCILSGMTVGVIIFYPVCGVLAEELHWEYVFYVPAAIAILWALFWHFLISNTPRDCRSISPVIITQNETALDICG